MQRSKMSTIFQPAVPWHGPTELLVDGTWRPAGSGRTLPVYDPSDGSVLALIADADVADGLAAVDAAASAAAAWAATPPRERAEVLRRAFELMRESREDIA